eukprot:GHVT01012700.1.p1 GENE.GHVT01012700.1~~GHVT01012700.1.p1  ORF type:complete len:115 (+),score=14.40 GHVT01012700.1:718-1062(+)
MAASSLRGPRPLHAMLACGFAALLSHVGSYGAASESSILSANLEGFPSNAALRRLAPYEKPMLEAGVGSKDWKEPWNAKRYASNKKDYSDFYLGLLANRINQNWKEEKKTPMDC